MPQPPNGATMYFHRLIADVFCCLYEESVFQGTEPIKSVISSMLDLTADLVLAECYN
ncbi:hypothetical protein [Nostoc sp.]|uniref:hypothetical protein n=1 Tax=Nostoc sp. TaxID=1180 RepID=UPI002FF9B129